MKYVKMLGLAAVAAAALMAFVGASSASATVLCTTDETVESGMCPSGEAYGVGTEVHAVLEAGKEAELETEFLTVKCKKSTVAGKVTNAGSTTETVVGDVEALTFEECNCDVTPIAQANGKYGTLEIHAIEDTYNGTLTGNAQEVTVSCSTIFGNVHCIYRTENTDLGKLTHSATTESSSLATMDAEASIPRKPTSSLCSGKALWNAKYDVTSPHPLFVDTG